MKVAFVSGRASHIVDGVPHYDQPNGRLIQALQRQYPDLALATYPDPDSRPNYYTLPVPVTSLHRLPWPHSFPNGLRRTREYQQVIRELERSHDVLIIQLPSKSFLALKKLRKPTIYHVCSNVVTMAANPVKYRGWRGLLARSFAGWIQRVQVQVAKKPQNHTVVHGEELARVFSRANPKKVVSSSLWSSEIPPLVHREPLSKSPHLLFVGRPSLEKGFDLLLEAFEQLHTQGLRPTLDFVGFDAEASKSLAPRFQEMLEKHRHYFKFWGMLPFGPQLFERFKAADLILLPSRSEGTPRVLIEARAMGCVAIGSDEGGIPSSITHDQDGLLVPSGNANALGNAVQFLVDNPEHYHNLRHQGYERVQHQTVENFAHTFVSLIENRHYHE